VTFGEATETVLDRRGGSLHEAPRAPHPVSIEEEFVRSLAPDDEGYYFAYGRCTEGPSGPGIRVIDGLNAREWAETENGKLFQRLFLGDRAGA